MYRHTKAGLVMLLTGTLLAGTASLAYATEDGPRISSGPGAVSETTAAASQGTVSESTAAAPQGMDETKSQSSVIVAGQSTEDSDDTSGPSANTAASSSGESESASGNGNAPGSSTAGSTGTAPSAGITDAAPSTETADAAAEGQNVLTESQAAALAAEGLADAAEASQLNNPLTVPIRQPHLQTTVLLNGAMTWSQPYVNDQQIEGAAQGFSSISTFLEHIHGNVLYRTYNSTTGWTAWAMNGQQTTGATSWIPVEAIQYRFSGPVADRYDIYYSTILSDGSTTGWARNGESAGTMNQGLYMTGYRLAFFVKGTDNGLDTANVLKSAHQDGMQVIDGVMQYIHGDGSGYTGWAWQGDDRYYFTDSMPVTGWQYIDGFKYYFQEDGKLLQDVEPVIGNGGPFMLKINKEMNCLTVYAKDGENGFIIPVKSFLTSVGDDTPIGTFKTPEKYRWRLMIHDVYTQYATRLGSGLPILIHSIIDDAANPYTVWASTYNNLGIARSAGCIRLASGDAKWVFDNCPLGTTVVVYNSSIAGPFERPTIKYEIPFEQTWDPTDPNVTEEGIAAESARIIAKFN